MGVFSKHGNKLFNPLRKWATLQKKMNKTEVLQIRMEWKGKREYP